MIRDDTRAQVTRAALIVLAVAVAYAPALRAGFVFDDHPFVVESPLLAGPLWRIWFSTDAPDYWPLTWTSLWIERRLFGDAPLGYHATNLALHAATSVLLWRVLRALDVRGAWLAGLLFAVHPVTVESAAWISERKNTLSAALLLLAALAWIRFDANARARARLGVAAAALFALALLAKTSIVLAPVALGAISWARRGRLDRRRAAVLGAMLALSLAAGAATVWFQRTHPLALWWLPERGAAERLGGAGFALLTYLRQAFLPVGLGLVHPGWPLGPGSPLFYAPLAGLALGAAALARFGGRLRRPVLLALGFHALLVLPVLGLVDLAWLKLGPVSNHLQYVALMGPVALVAWAASGLAARWPRPAALAAGATLVAALGASTPARAAAFRDDLTLWRSAVDAAPGSATARLELAGHLLAAGRADEAVRELDEAARVARHPAQRHRALGFAALQRGDVARAAAELELAAAASPDPLIARDLAVALILSGRAAEALVLLEPLTRASPRDADFATWHAAALARLGREREARDGLARALGLAPDHPEVEARLAPFLAPAPAPGRAPHGGAP